MRYLVTAVITTVVAAGPAAPAQAAERTVSYRGHVLTVPADWPVFDLAADPGTCVRFDRNAVYLGSPGKDQRCPADVKQVTDAVLLEPSGDGVRVTVSGDRFRAAATKTEPPSRPEVTTVQPGAFSGQGFDTCAAPSQETMDAWLASPYRAVGVYIGGVHRGCAQPNLTPEWVARQVQNGWRLIPTYVGLQAPCTHFSNKLSTDPVIARTEGREAANDAVGLAEALGMAAGSTLYNDMEAYNAEDPMCASAVMSFLSGWTDLLRERGYRSGVYSSAGSGIVHLARNHDNTEYSRPDSVWFAWWNNQADVDGGKYLPAEMWPRQRIHQYVGDHQETYNGVTVNMDSNVLELAAAQAPPRGGTVL